MILGKVLYDRDWVFVSFFKKAVYFFGSLRLFFGAKKTLRDAPSPFPLLIKKGGGFLCNACGLCEVACPSRCIEVAAVGSDKSPLGGRLEEFFLDVRRCIGCRICLQVCPEGALDMDTPYPGDIFAGGRLDKEELAVDSG